MEEAGISFSGVSLRVVPKELKSPRGHAQVKNATLCISGRMAACMCHACRWVQVKAALGSIVAQVIKLYQVRFICGASVRQSACLHGRTRECVLDADSELTVSRWCHTFVYRAGGEKN